VNELLRLVGIQGERLLFTAGELALEFFQRVQISRVLALAFLLLVMVQTLLSLVGQVHHSCVSGAEKAARLCIVVAHLVDEHDASRL